MTADIEQAGLYAPARDPGEPIAVRVDRVRLERGRAFGDVWLGWALWRALQMDTLLERGRPAGREDVPWAPMAAVLVLARLCEPSSALHIAEDWYRRTALEDLLALPALLVNDDRCYRALDRLLPTGRRWSSTAPISSIRTRSPVVFAGRRVAARAVVVSVAAVGAAGRLAHRQRRPDVHGNPVAICPGDAGNRPEGPVSSQGPRLASGPPCLERPPSPPPMGHGTPFPKGSMAI